MDAGSNPCPVVPLASVPEGEDPPVTGGSPPGIEEEKESTERVPDEAPPVGSPLSSVVEEGEKVRELAKDTKVKVGPTASKIKAVTYCAIPNCRVKSDQLVVATSPVLAYYGVRNTNRMTVLKVCMGCVAKANKFLEESVEILKNKGCIFELKHEPQHIPGGVVDVNDNESKDNVAGANDASSITARSDEEVEIDFDRTEVEGIVKSILDKFKIKRQLQKCKETATKEAVQLQSEFLDMKKEFEETDNILYDTCQRYNLVFDQRPQRSKYVTKEVEINADGSVRQRSTIKNDSIFANTDAIKQLTINASDPEKITTPKLEQDDIKEIKKTKTSSLLPTPAVIPRVKPKKNDIVYAMNSSLLTTWLQAEILEVVENSDTKQTEFIVHFEPTKNGKSTGGGEKNGSFRNVRQLCLKEMAYNVPYPFQLPVGTRVIANFKDQFNPKNTQHYYVGIVAEPAKRNTNERYLIFFDDGYAQYVLPNEVFVVCESSKEVWNDVYPDAYDFIKEYVIKYPEWPKVRLAEGSVVATEWNGKWLVARVLEVDCNLIRVRFENDGREEWIFRGSSRFRPIYRILANNEDVKENKVPQRLYDSTKGQGDPRVVHENVDCLRNGQQLAKKSTAGSSLEGRILTGQMRSHLRVDPELCVEFQGTVTQVKIPNDVIKPKDFISHDCTKSCVIDYVPTNATKGKSPLSVPLFLGWAREIGKYPRHAVFYRTPCGLRVRDYDELSEYLKTTGSNLSLEFFSFDQLVNCLNQFEPARALVNVKDISYGNEAVPVQCVNSIDHDSLPYIEYIPRRIIGPDVNLSTDNGFMVCCDCTDDCQDKEKCACWKRTMEGVSFNKNFGNNRIVPMVGYENRRLKDHIVSGIYECNVNCKCRATCTNRVVQNGVIWPLQLFKTARKGWGIRALYDMPHGAFICIYAGDVLTDQSASADGIENGDEYLAQLDFMEILEDTKDDFESDVTDIEDEQNPEDRDDEVAPSGKKPRLEEGLTDERDNVAEIAPVNSEVRLYAARRTGGQKTNLDYVFNDDEESITARTRIPSYFNPKVSQKKRRRTKLRDLYSQDEQMYLINAKSKGNVGRYLNHSCKPNVFVQNVFVNTHDLRFPMVAFFTNAFVKAGTELTWDYHYQIGSVPDKSMHCYCMTPFCKGRLL